MSRILFEWEEKCLKEGYFLVIGVDEAGRGPLAGPVVAAACVLKISDVPLKHPMFGLIRDSKLLSEKQRESLYDFICENFYVGIGICDHKTIDRINILEATYLAMKKAVADLASRAKKNREYMVYDKKCIILIDGNKIIPNFSMDQRAIVNGDKSVKSISAASIIAKITRDRMMREYHSEFPQYNFSKHKGYGTREHIECINKFGPCKIHRRSFSPVKDVELSRKR